MALGVESGDDVEVTQGLREGEQVVARGQFLIDSEARLRSVLGNMAAPASAPSSGPATTPAVHVAEGVVEKVAPMPSPSLMAR